MPKSHQPSGQTRIHKLSHLRQRPRRMRGQQAIEPERVTQIQQALIREHYLTGEADRQMGHNHCGRDAEVSGRPWLANKADARLRAP